MRQIKIKNTIIGDEKVKICVPVSSRDFSELEAELEYAFNSSCDIMELRYDFFAEIISEQCGDNEQRHLGDVLSEIKKKQEEFKKQNKVKRDKLTLFTFRTKIEGGFGTDDGENYYNINEQAILSGQVDIIDVEFTKENHKMINE